MLRNQLKILRSPRQKAKMRGHGERQKLRLSSKRTRGKEKNKRKKCNESFNREFANGQLEAAAALLPRRCIRAVVHAHLNEPWLHDGRAVHRRRDDAARDTSVPGQRRGRDPCWKRRGEAASGSGGWRIRGCALPHAVNGTERVRGSRPAGVTGRAH